MKKLLPVLAALLALGASWSAPVFATPSAHGSTVQIPPLISKGAVQNQRARDVLRLPIQAGKVSKMVTTNLLPEGPSWIAKGDKYYSLCAPNRQMVACAPIVATSVLHDIEVSALADTNGGPLLTFKIVPGTKVAPKRLAYAIQYFLARTNKQVAHFNRKAVSYARMPVATPVQGGPALNLVAAGGGGGCSYDDEGSYDCSGGDVGGGDTGATNDDAGLCQGNCQYPQSDNNGDPDPCIDANGNPVCQVVVIPGTRPDEVEPMSLPTCSPIGPFTIQCSSPPPFGSEPQELPRATPWFPQAVCNFSSIFCSAGQVPNNPPPLSDQERREQAKQECYAEANRMMTYCRTIKPDADPLIHQQCVDNAWQFYKECDLIGNQVGP